MAVRSKFVSQTGAGASAHIDIEDSNDVRISYAVSLVGSCTYTVQHSLDGETWFDNTDNQDQTTAQDGNYVFPIRGVRVNVTAGTGTATLYVRQLVV